MEEDDDDVDWHADPLGLSGGADLGLGSDDEDEEGADGPELHGYEDGDGERKREGRRGSDLRQYGPSRT